MPMIMAMFMFFMIIIKMYIMVIKLIFWGVRFCCTGRASRYSARGRTYRR